MDEFLKKLNQLLDILGSAATLGDAKNWVEVEENAKRLREEGHETDDEPTNVN